MKSLEELAKIREEALVRASGNASSEAFQYTITIGMATCGITAGARTVFTTLLECMTTEGYTGLKIMQTGCFGKCSEEPMMKVEDLEGNTCYYGKLDENKATQIYQEHIRGNRPIEAYQVEMEQVNESRV